MSTFTCLKIPSLLSLSAMTRIYEKHSSVDNNTNKSFENLKQPNIFHYKNYRLFLDDWYMWKKKINPSYSATIFARQAGLASHTLLSMVIRRKRNIKQSTIRAFAKAIKLPAKERLYFEKLVHFDQAKNSEERVEYFEELAKLAEKSNSIELKTMRDYTKYLSNWFNLAIRELVLLPDFKDDPEWISQKLKKRVSKLEARKAWELLLELGYVKFNPKTIKYELEEPALDFDPGEANFAVRNFHKSYLERTKIAIDEEAYGERLMSSLTIAVNEKDLDQIKTLINQFRKDLNKKYSVDNNQKVTGNSHVVALNMQLLKLTQDNSNNKEEKREET